ncbi:unnamed protein product [Prorocentrum cordatum]|uniref:Uncharacterized protein n=1 Tax=Prorocentrum cordatum TaxID=2364126 RepID=A0ABN9SVX7_9DINO|nr:unnamed protein product [Polarella glacialis]
MEKVLRELSVEFSDFCAVALRRLRAAAAEELEAERARLARARILGAEDGQGRSAKQKRPLGSVGLAATGDRGARRLLRGVAAAAAARSSKAAPATLRRAAPTAAAPAAKAIPAKAAPRAVAAGPPPAKAAPAAGAARDGRLRPPPKASPLQHGRRPLGHAEPVEPAALAPGASAPAVGAEAACEEDESRMFPDEPDGERLSFIPKRAAAESQAADRAEAEAPPAAPEQTPRPKRMPVPTGSPLGPL